MTTDNNQCGQCGRSEGSRYSLDGKVCCIECSPFNDLCSRVDAMRIQEATKALQSHPKPRAHQTDDIYTHGAVARKVLIGKDGHRDGVLLALQYKNERSLAKAL